MTESHVSILYRGPLSSCNYDCRYCPFAKRHETAEELRTDRKALERFSRWVSGVCDRDLSILFTPWGEAVTRRWYQSAMISLSHQDHVRRVVAQTNLSWPMDWLDDCDPNRLALWCTYHPSQVSRGEFLRRCEELERRQISHSVGMVAIPDDFAEIEAVRRELSPSTYLWLNAWDVQGGQKYEYTIRQIYRLTSIDPHFKLNTVNYSSLGRRCRTGSTVFSVDGNGEVRRCHFVPERLGNIYASDWEFPVESALCPNQTCGCHIGYVHMPDLALDQIYGDTILERIPQAFTYAPAQPVVHLPSPGETYGQ